MGYLTWSILENASCALEKDVLFTAIVGCTRDV